MSQQNLSSKLKEKVILPFVITVIGGVVASAVFHGFGDASEYQAKEGNVIIAK